MTSAIEVKLSETVPLHLKLDRDDATKFVRATVTDHLGAAVTGSPFTLSHIDKGMYQSTSLSMPDKLFIIASYAVFNDSGFTAKSNFRDGVDLFVRRLPIQALVQSTDLIGFVESDDDIVGEVSSSEDLEGGLMPDETVGGEIISDGDIEGSIIATSTSNVVGEVEDC